jgi:uncharacterized protein (DUF1786 family)
MRILAADVGTGTQDILLYDSEVELENCLKLVMPSPTMLVARRVKAATRERRQMLLTGVTMGGGPSQWAVEDHVRAGLPVYATATAARSFNDELEIVEREMGIRIVSEDEAATLRRTQGDDLIALELKDFDYDAVRNAFSAFGLDLTPDALAVAVFDHGNAPPGYSDRQFRFDYLLERIQAHNRLSAFAYLAPDVPAIMTRMAAVARTATFDGPVLIMDTAPAAILGALLDPQVGKGERAFVANVGNFHTLAFRLGPGGIEGVFEHHTGLIDRDKLDTLITRLAEGTLQHEEVFNDQGHGALVFEARPMPLDALAVVGPRRSLMRGSRHRPYFAVPYGDMMLAGCFGLLRAYADHVPEAAPAIFASLGGADRRPPWELL